MIIANRSTKMSSMPSIFINDDYSDLALDTSMELAQSMANN